MISQEQITRARARRGRLECKLSLSTPGNIKPRNPTKVPHIGRAHKSHLARLDNSRRIGIIEAAVLTRGTGSHLKPPPRTGEPTVVSSLNLHLLPLSSAQLRGGSSVPLVILFPPSEPRNSTPKNAPYDERNRVQEHQSVSSVETTMRGVHARLRHTPKLRF